MPPTVQREVSKDILRGIALTTLIFIVSAYIPVLGFFFSLLIPLPTLFYRSKLGRNNGAIVPAVSAIIMALAIGRVSFEILFFTELLILGFVLAELLKKNLSVEKTVLYTCGAVISTGLFALMLYANLIGKGLAVLISDYIARNLEMALALYETLGMSPENIQVISDSLDVIHYMLVRLIPALAASSILFVTWVNLLMVRPLLKKERLFCPNYGPLKLWTVPEPLVWGVIGCGVMLLLPDRALKMFAVNGLIVLMTIYFFSGIAIVSYYFDKKRFPIALRFFLYSLIALQQVALFMVIGLGFFDMWLNLRKLETKKE
ncbi:hypothetical protein DENIS_0007 [Desulfonema ishimotonii]|uniref:DUF2232 domain-containing protein n=1 Tax=Desulfonema ishimotonii TaxID=45657 RepID=A0A401FQ29_9BACT|nr:YybS family protein [Desulfonema ishimotonii]GBC59077.1 hypothetical protein DENIS_0007 [Desulfonema ishimotonii]